MINRKDLRICGDVLDSVSKYEEKETCEPVLFVNSTVDDFALIDSFCLNENVGHQGEFHMQLNDALPEAKSGIEYPVDGAKRITSEIGVFCEVSNEVRGRAQFHPALYFGYANGWLGYLPTQAGCQYGDYEVETMSPLMPVAVGKLNEYRVEHHKKDPILSYSIK